MTGVCDGALLENRAPSGEHTGPRAGPDDAPRRLYQELATRATGVKWAGMLTYPLTMPSDGYLTASARTTRKSGIRRRVVSSIVVNSARASVEPMQRCFPMPN